MNMFRRRATALIASALAALTGALTWAAGAPAAGAAVGCAVSYRVTDQWAGGFGADVTVTNLGDAVNGWTLAWTFTAGQRVEQAWNATVVQSGAGVTARNVDYNRTIATGGSVGFGFNGAWSAGNPVPASFTLNGSPCTGAAGTASPSPSPSGPVGAFFADDHTHFEAAGARQIAGLVAGAVRDQRLGLAAYLR